MFRLLAPLIRRRAREVIEEFAIIEYTTSAHFHSLSQPHIYGVRQRAEIVAALRVALRHRCYALSWLLCRQYDRIGIDPRVLYMEHVDVWPEEVMAAPASLTASARRHLRAL